MSKNEPRPGAPKPPGQPSAKPARPAKRVSTPEERAKENALFRDAGLDAKLAAAESKDPEAAASILARKHPHAIVRLMGDAFKRGQEADLAAAKRVCGNLFDKGARLIDVFLRTKPRNDTILARCARMVGDVGAPEGVDRLRALLKDPAAPVRVAAFEGLARGMDADKLGALVREFVSDSEESPEVKIAAIEALGEAKAIGASSIAAKCIHDGNGDVRKAAARALTRMGIPAIPSILEDCRARGQAALGSVVDSLKAIMGVSGDMANAPPEQHEQVRKLLVGALRDKDAPVRCAAAVALGAVGTKEDVPALDDAITFEKNEFSQAQMECARGDLKKRAGMN